MFRLEEQAKGWCVIDVKYNKICNDCHFKLKSDAETYLDLLRAFCEKN